MGDFESNTSIIDAYFYDNYTLILLSDWTFQIYNNSNQYIEVFVDEPIFMDQPNNIYNVVFANMISNQSGQINLVVGFNYFDLNNNISNIIKLC